MPIQASVQNNQITANVGETQIDVSVSGGFGPSGLQGPAATVTVGTVSTGAPGSSASVVNAGSSSAAVLNFVIPAGQPGATGPQGAQGPAGTTSWNGITDRPSTFAPSAHQHAISEVVGLSAALDGKQAVGSYATLVGGRVPESQLPPIVTTWEGLTGKPSTFPPSSHTHDDRYYTEAEVDTLLAGKQASGSYVLTTDARLSDARQPLTHTHTASQISDFTSAVIAAAPPTTNASLLTSGTLPDARLSANIARTSDITAAVANVVNAAPASLDTLKELADALGNDASFSATVTNSLASKAPLANPTFTGTVSGITKAMVGLSNVPNTDATARVNHTGTQAISTVSGLQAALDAKASLAGAAFTGSVDVDGTVAATLADFSSILVNGNHTITSATVSGSSRLVVDGQVVVLGNDSRLTDARTPLAHNQAWSTITSTPTTLAGYGITDAVGSSDARLTDARTPLFHTHSATQISDFSSAVAAASPEEVVEYTTPADFPATGNSSLLYVATDNARAYRWVGSQYAEVGPTSLFMQGHTHSGGEIVSGTIADARLSANARQAIDNLLHPFLLAGM